MGSKDAAVPLPTAAPHHRPSQPSALPPGLSTTAAVSQPPLSLSLPLPQTPSLAHSSPWLSTMAQPRAARKQSSERLRTTPNPLPGPCQCHQQSHPAFVHLGDTCGMCHSAPSAPHGASPPGRAHVQPQSCPRWECQTFLGRAPTSNLTLHSGTRVTRSMCHSALTAPHGASSPRQGATPGSNPVTDGLARPFGRAPTAAPRDELRHSPRRRRYSEAQYTECRQGGRSGHQAASVTPSMCRHRYRHTYSTLNRQLGSSAISLIQQSPLRYTRATILHPTVQPPPPARHDTTPRLHGGHGPALFSTPRLKPTAPSLPRAHRAPMRRRPARGAPPPATGRAAAP